MNNQHARINMITQQLRTGEVLNRNILSLYDELPRDAFVPESLHNYAYSDLQLPLPHNECMMTPLEEATILQALALEGHENVLEIGTGSGFFTALLSRRCEHVTSIDYYADFTENARQKLAQYRCHNITLHTGNAYQGWIDKAPFDVVIYTGALHAIEDMHRLQVLPGGKLFAIVGDKPCMQGQLHHLDHQEQWHTNVLFETELPALINPSPPKTFTF
ncbi:MAG: protein-L-isoaspartate O-methyltransferase [Legionella sp.]|jgi:protein-L-isoaspartate(D-aspartate) O-methyltransferase|nr:protein-L-isoaspartate O-methyltransferase [Legionella sp.]